MHLGDDEMVDVEELADLLHRYVGLNAPVNELVVRSALRMNAAFIYNKMIIHHLRGTLSYLVLP